MSDSKGYGSKVMTFVREDGLYDMTIGKNYNVKNDTNPSRYVLIDDNGDKRFIGKQAFKEPLECSNTKYDVVGYLKNGDIINSELLKSGNEPIVAMSEAGAKHDSGKLKPTLLINDMPLAINEVLKVLKFGAEKYSEGNWLKVENGINRYRNAGLRHLLASEDIDDESGLSHLSHAVTSLLMELELRLREENAK